MTLKELGIGQSAIIETVGGTGALRQHFLDMGVIPGAEVTVLKYAPLGDPVEIQIHGYSLTLRLDDAAKIGVKPINKHTPEEEKEVSKAQKDTSSGSGRRRNLSSKGKRGSSAQGHCFDVCACRKSEQRQDDPFQRADRGEAACGKFSGSYGGSQRRRDPRS